MTFLKLVVDNTVEPAFIMSVDEVESVDNLVSHMYKLLEEIHATAEIEDTDEELNELSKKLHDVRIGLEAVGIKPEAIVHNYLKLQHIHNV